MGLINKIFFWVVFSLLFLLLVVVLPTSIYLDETKNTEFCESYGYSYSYGSSCWEIKNNKTLVVHDFKSIDGKRYFVENGFD